MGYTANACFDWQK